MKKCPICEHEMQVQKYEENSWVGLVEEHQTCNNCNKYYLGYFYGADREVIGKVDLQEKMYNLRKKLLRKERIKYHIKKIFEPIIKWLKEN